MIEIVEDLCDLCGTCVAVCPHLALELFETRLVIDEEKCTGCLLCRDVCPMHAILEDEH